MPITRFPMSLIKNEESPDDPNNPLSLHQIPRAHKQPIKGHNNMHSLSSEYYHKSQATTPRAAIEKDFHNHHHFHLLSPDASRMSTAANTTTTSPHTYQPGLTFPMTSRSNQMAQYPFHSLPVEAQVYKTEPQEIAEATPVGRSLDNFVNRYAPPADRVERGQQQQQQGPPNNTGYAVSNMANPLSPWERPTVTWGPQYSPAQIFMNRGRIPAEPSEGGTVTESVEHFAEPQHYTDGPFSPPEQEACSFTWDIKDDRAVPEHIKPKRRKLTPYERARTKALKLAGGACDNCRRKKKKCTHKDLSKTSAVAGKLPDADIAAALANNPPSTIDSDIQSRLFSFSAAQTNSVLAYMRPEDDPGMRTPSDTPSIGGDGFNVFSLDTAGAGQQFDHQGHPSTHGQGHQEGGDNSANPWYRAMGYNADYMAHPYH